VGITESEQCGCAILIVAADLKNFGDHLIRDIESSLEDEQVSVLSSVKRKPTTALSAPKPLQKALRRQRRLNRHLAHVVANEGPSPMSRNGIRRYVRDGIG
jgi:hypothetical protein